MPQGDVLVVPLGRQAELVQRFQADVDVPVLEEFVVEAFLRKISVQGDKRAVFLGRVGERALISKVLGTVVPYFFLSCVVVLLGGLGPPKHDFDIGAVQIGFREIRIEFDCLVIIVQGIHPSSHLHEIGGAVVVGQDVVRIDVYDMVHVGQGILEITHLCTDETPVIEGQGIAGFVSQDPVQVGHGSIVVVLVVVHQGSVEIGESVGGVKGDRLVHV